MEHPENIAEGKGKTFADLLRELALHPELEGLIKELEKTDACEEFESFIQLHKKICIYFAAHKHMNISSLSDFNPADIEKYERYSSRKEKSGKLLSQIQEWTETMKDTQVEVKNRLKSIKGRLSAYEDLGLVEESSNFDKFSNDEQVRNECSTEFSKLVEEGPGSFCEFLAQKELSNASEEKVRNLTKKYLIGILLYDHLDTSIKTQGQAAKPGPAGENKPLELEEEELLNKFKANEDPVYSTYNYEVNFKKLAYASMVRFFKDTGIKSV